MNKILLATLLSCTIGNVYSACNYDLEGFINDPDNPTAQKFPTVIGQKVSYKILNSQNAISYSANHSSLKIENGTISAGLLPLPQSGIVGFEINTDTIPVELTNKSQDTKIFAVFLPDANGLNQTILISYANNTSLSYQGNKKNLVFILVASTHPDTKKNETIYGYALPMDGISKQNIGLYFNRNTNQVGLIVNKNNLGYVTTLFSKPKAITFLPQVAFNGFEANSQYLNKTMSMELVTDKSKFTNVFPTGTTDICGN